MIFRECMAVFGNLRQSRRILSFTLFQPICVIEGSLNHFHCKELWTTGCLLTNLMSNHYGTSLDRKIQQNWFKTVNATQVFWHSSTLQVRFIHFLEFKWKMRKEAEMYMCSSGTDRGKLISSVGFPAARKTQETWIAVDKASCRCSPPPPPSLPTRAS